MEKIIQFFVALVVSTLFTGCSSYYHGPKKHEQASTLEGFNSRKDLSHWMRIRVIQVDKKNTGAMLLGKNKLRIHPGHHTLTVFMQYNNGTLKAKGPLHARFPLEFNAIANEKYQILGKVEQNKFVSWAVDHKGNKVSGLVVLKPLAQPELPLAALFQPLKG